MSKSHALGLSEDMKMCGFSSQGVVMLFSVSPSHRAAETGCSLRADEDRMDKSDNSSLWCSTVFCSLVKLIISLASRKDFLQESPAFCLSPQHSNWPTAKMTSGASALPGALAPFLFFAPGHRLVFWTLTSPALPEVLHSRLCVG